MEVKEILNHGLTLRQADHLLDKTISFPEIGSTFERIRPITDFRKDDAEARVCKYMYITPRGLGCLVYFEQKKERKRGREEERCRD